MTDNIAQNLKQRVYRVDKFEVPVQARDEFLEKVQETHELLRTQNGFLQDFLLEQSTENDVVSIVTIVEWENFDAVENAKKAVQAFREKTKFNPQDLISRLGIKADLANYTRIDA